MGEREGEIEGERSGKEGELVGKRGVRVWT
jgi:hypothetical protein